MTITDRVQGAFLDDDCRHDDARLVRLAPNAPPSKGPTRRQGRPWSHEEHDRFLQAMEMFPSGPWKAIAAHVGSRTTRQTMTHAQKYRQKIERWKRGATIKSSATASSTTSSMSSASPAAPPTATASIKNGRVLYLKKLVCKGSLGVDGTNEDAIFWQMPRDFIDERNGGDCHQFMV